MVDMRFLQLQARSTSLANDKITEARHIGLFKVRIHDASVLYVKTFADSLEPGNSSQQLIIANAAAPANRTIILESGKYVIDLPPAIAPFSTFGSSLDTLGINNPGGWTDASSGDFDIDGNVTIVGDLSDDTIIDAQGLDRAFKVGITGNLTLSRVTVQNGGVIRIAGRWRNLDNRLAYGR